MDELEIRRKVREHYGAASESCCGAAGTSSCGSNLVQTQSSGSVAIEAMPRLGVGDSMDLLEPREGETVLDLGSGPGRDVLVAAERVGPKGRAIGVDATPEMVFQARQAAASLGRTNAEFRLGEIEHLPIDVNSVDGIASDCVINLSPDKDQVFREAYRVLKPGGRVVVSDVVADRALSPEVRRDPERWAACEAGAVTEAEYVALMRAAGFEAIRSERKGSYKEGLSRTVITALKPARSA